MILWPSFFWQIPFFSSRSKLQFWVASIFFSSYLVSKIGTYPGTILKYWHKIWDISIANCIINFTHVIDLLDHVRYFLKIFNIFVDLKMWTPKRKFGATRCVALMIQLEQQQHREFVGGVADFNYLYPARWDGSKIKIVVWIFLI